MIWMLATLSVIWTVVLLMALAFSSNLPVPEEIVTMIAAVVMTVVIAEVALHLEATTESLLKAYLET